MKPERVIAFAALVVVTAILVTDNVCADTIVIEDGTEKGYVFDCLIHDATRKFPEQDKETWVEFEIGTWTLSIPRAITRSIEYNDNYEKPKTQEEIEKRVREIMELWHNPPPGVFPAPTQVLKTETLFAEVTYLVNFARATLGGLGEPVPVEKGDQLPEGTSLAVKQNSRAETAIGERVRVGVRAGAEVQFSKMEERVRGEQTNWMMDLDVPFGGIWIDISGLEGGETVDLRVVGCLVEGIASDTLLSVTSSLGTEYSYAYWKGEGELRVRNPRLEANGFSIRPGQMVTFGTGQGNSVQAERLDSRGAAEWENWREFKPVEIALEPMVISPPLASLPSKGVLYSLREAGGGQSLDVRPEIRTNVLQNLQAYLLGLEEFHEDVGRYPTLEEGLGSLRSNPGLSKWDGPYVDENVQEIDPWDQPYRYRLLGEGESVKAIVYSSGQNRVDEFGLGSDIHSAMPKE